MATMDIVNYLFIIVFMIFATFLIVLTMCLTRNKDHVTNKVIRNKPSTIYMKTRVLVARVFTERFLRIKNVAQNICDTNKMTRAILKQKTISASLIHLWTLKKSAPILSLH